MQSKYDVIVVGAGHAGCEAARACARMGLRTAMITMNIDLIAQMSCNPAVGGIAKGHLVREIDALGGIMGELTDAVGIQFRLLNTSRGPAVWSPRAQCDKKQYRLNMRELLENEPNLRILQAEVAALGIDDTERRFAACILRDGRTLYSFGRGCDDGNVSEWTGACWRDDVQLRSQRRSPVSVCSAISFERLGLHWTRLKTGTPPRLDGRTIDWDRFEPQYGRSGADSVFVHDGRESNVRRFNATSRIRPIAHRQVVQESIARSPLYSGQIEGVGPRYCPSIEDKFAKFPDKARHQLFPGARGSGYVRSLCQWHVHQHAGRCSGGYACLGRGLEERRDDSSRLRD